MSGCRTAHRPGRPQWRDGEADAGFSGHRITFAVAPVIGNGKLNKIGWEARIRTWDPHVNSVMLYR
jgi:hypothetical protein